MFNDLPPWEMWIIVARATIDNNEVVKLFVWLNRQPRLTHVWQRVDEMRIESMLSMACSKIAPFIMPAWAESFGCPCDRFALPDFDGVDVWLRLNERLDNW